MLPSLQNDETLENCMLDAPFTIIPSLQNDETLENRMLDAPFTIIPSLQNDETQEVSMLEGAQTSDTRSEGVEEVDIRDNLACEALLLARYDRLSPSPSHGLDAGPFEHTQPFARSNHQVPGIPNASNGLNEQPPTAVQVEINDGVGRYATSTLRQFPPSFDDAAPEEPNLRFASTPLGDLQASFPSSRNYAFHAALHIAQQRRHAYLSHLFQPEDRVARWVQEQQHLITEGTAFATMPDNQAGYDGMETAI